MWLVGIITGFVAIFISLILLIFWIVALASYGSLIGNYPGLILSHQTRGGARGAPPHRVFGP